MKYAADFKQIARDALFGNWKVAILTGFVASLLGGTLSSTGGASSNRSGNDDSISDSLSQLQLEEILEILLPIFVAVFSVLIIWGLATFIIGGATKLGYAKFNLNLIDRKPAAFSDLFSQYNRLGDGICMDLLMGLYVALWSLLFIIPGIVKSYSYAMTPYILAEHPEMTANQAITESRRIMQGNKGRLFCLRFSFLGWMLLLLVPVLVLIPLALLGTFGTILYCILVVVIAVVGNLFLAPYQEAAQAAFYREITYVPTYIPRDLDNN